MEFYRHILLTTDLTEKSRYTACKALQIAELHGAKITLLHVIEPLPAYALTASSSINFENTIYERAKRDMKGLARELVIPETDQKIDIGSVKNCILKTAHNLNVDLIIIGSHGRHEVDYLLGSTATAVLHRAQCDVLIVRNDKILSPPVKNLASLSS